MPHESTVAHEKKSANDSRRTAIEQGLMSNHKVKKHVYIVYIYKEKSDYIYFKLVI